ncbi:hypothetical protein K788_0009082 [Paraburkholderia caribensis MBA4]|uniref:Uncharacterized protein n=1 Tax=Paraburkholderia caribensis MBA4 TaxID=1323664 RepID=A0A0P0R9T7_9BURK|nr:hypothetical protein K788_0009082 [Paraburkholderia caribensis MBA4]
MKPHRPPRYPWRKLAGLWIEQGDLKQDSVSRSPLSTAGL